MVQIDPIKKAAYQQFEANPDLEFEFFLAAELGMTVARLRAELTSDECARWAVYFGRRSQRRQLAQ